MLLNFFKLEVSALNGRKFFDKKGFFVDFATDQKLIIIGDDQGLTAKALKRTRSESDELDSAEVGRMDDGHGCGLLSDADWSLGVANSFSSSNWLLVLMLMKMRICRITS